MSPNGILPNRTFDPAAFEAAVNALLRATGIDPDGSHTRNTAERVRALWQEQLLAGQETSLADALGEGFADPATGAVTVRDIAVHGVCPHHLMPFTGVAHIMYRPGGRLFGFGRLCALADAATRRLTLQEWATTHIANALVRHGGAEGAVCLIEAKHLCAELGHPRRGHEKMRTVAQAGTVRDADLRTFLA